MLTLRPGNERGHAEHGWLDSRHTFSFSDYFDPKQMGFRALRVINEDRVQPHQGFASHPHRDMEIITYVLSGAIEHRDSMGTVGVLHAGDLQRMSAGTGVVHSEMNRGDSLLHFLQIWVLPDAEGIKPSYQQKAFTESERTGIFRAVVSRGGLDGTLDVHQDVTLYSTLLPAGAKATHPIAPGRHAWLQLVRGSGTLNGLAIKAGDGVAVTNESRVELSATDPLEALLFDLA